MLWIGLWQDTAYLSENTVNTNQPTNRPVTLTVVKVTAVCYILLDYVKCILSCILSYYLNISVRLLLQGRGPKKHLKRINAPKHWMLDKLGGVFVSTTVIDTQKLEIVFCFHFR